MNDIHLERLPITPIYFWTQRPTESGSGEADNGQIVEPGYSYDDKAASKWLTATVTVPGEWAGERVGLNIVITGGEPLLYVDGKPYQALDYNHAAVLLHEMASGGETHELLIEIYAPTSGREITIQEALLVRLDRARESGLLDNSAERQIAALSKVSEDSSRGSVTCIGHSHLDLAYLWALPNTRKKVGRTWASMLRLLDECPEFRFTQSQPFLYDVCKTDYPDLWERVKTRVAEERWEITGAMWVEPDANIPSGESLIRQVLYGQAFYKREFGAVSRVVWLPDTFGFPASFHRSLPDAEFTIY